MTTTLMTIEMDNVEVSQRCVMLPPFARVVFLFFLVTSVARESDDLSSCVAFFVVAPRISLHHFFAIRSRKKKRTALSSVPRALENLLLRRLLFCLL